MKISALLLVVWYCMSIIGFNVHTCTGTGRTFIAAFADGMSCAEIHPEHHCCADSCKPERCHDCHKTKSCCHEGAFETQTCCSNEYQMIQLSGCRLSMTSDSQESDCEVLDFVPEYSFSYIAAADSQIELLQFRESCPGPIFLCDFQSAYGVWRI